MSPGVRLLDDDAPGGLPRARPEEVGLDPLALQALVLEAEQQGTDALLLLRGGRVAVERYFRGTRGPVELMSVTKSIAALGLGFLVADGVLSLEMPLSSWFPEWRGDARAHVTLRHVLTHTTGLEHEASAASICRQGDQVAYARRLDLVETPGTRFDYSNEAVELLAGVVHLAAGRHLDTLLHERLFAPLDVGEWSWIKDRAGNVQVFSGLSMTARGLARIGMLLLGGGAWRGERILTADWVRQCTSSGGPATPYYGLLWFLRTGAPFGRAFYAHGWLGQRLLVYPEWDLAVVRLRAATEGGGDVENRRVAFGGLTDAVERAVVP